MTGNEEEIPNKQIVETILKYFFYTLNTRSQTQHRNLVAHFKAFIVCFPKKAKVYLKKLEEITENPVQFFIKNNKNFFTGDQERRIDRAFPLAQIDYLYFRDTSIISKLKTSYDVSYKRPTRDQRTLHLYELLEITAFIRDTLYSDIIEVAKEMDLEVPLILPNVEKQDKGDVGIV